MLGYEIKKTYLNLRQSGIRNGDWFKGRENEGKKKKKLERKGEIQRKNQPKREKWPNGVMVGNNVRETGECGEAQEFFLALLRFDITRWLSLSLSLSSKTFLFLFRASIIGLL